MTCLRFLYIFGGSGLSTVRHLWPGCLSNALSREVFFRIKRFTDIFSAKTHQTCKKSKLNLSVGKDAFDKLNSCLMGFGALHLLLYSNHSKIVMSATKISISKVKTAMRHQSKITTFFNDSEFSHQIPIGHHWLNMLKDNASKKTACFT